MFEPTIGVFAPCDPRLDRESRERAFNISKMAASRLAKEIKLIDGSPVKVVRGSTLIDG